MFLFWQWLQQKLVQLLRKGQVRIKLGKDAELVLGKLYDDLKGIAISVRF